VPTGGTKEKKKVCFRNGSAMVQIRVIPLAEDARLRPVADIKDAPTPRKVASQQLQRKGPDLEDVLYHILSWNPKWLTVSLNCIHTSRISLQCGRSKRPLFPFPLKSFRMVAIQLSCTEGAVTAGGHPADSAAN
jgi:hypothetical protein